MMKKLLIIGAVFLMIVGCTPTKSEDYAPLAEGNKWTYTTTTNDTIITTTVTEVESAVTIGDKGDGWKIKSTVDTLAPTYNYTYKGSDTLFVYADENGDTLTYWEPLDLTDGTKWEVENPYTNVTTSYEVVGDEDVTVEAGTFTGAKKIKSTYSTETTMGAIKMTTTAEGFQYKAKGIGLVKTEMTTTIITEDTTGTIPTDTMTTKTITELKSYEIK